MQLQVYVMFSSACYCGLFDWVSCELGCPKEG